MFLKKQDISDKNPSSTVQAKCLSIHLKGYSGSLAFIFCQVLAFLAKPSLKCVNYIPDFDSIANINWLDTSTFKKR